MSEIFTNKTNLSRGRKIERVRKLRGWTQSDLAEKLGVSKQAISKLEQAENIGDEKLNDVAKALGVTFEGLRDFTEEKVLYNTNNFYENCGVTASNIVANVETINNPLKETIEMFERQLEAARKDLLEIVKNKINRND
ncbi:helix-turn-helix transcriptional regulator [Chryseobacterium sp. Ch-15]|uniref:Helix-turn-helix transcriptional regulator n=1 Tax=Chryseobacterium muglaense TaxID=2893752 RepID=A0A9Q3UZ76_9FLAO|nr:helix-turn-helix transcriptional regulator [Chryseobacterium muglaense]MBD3903338.1 helix-turn-helix transcriptional regulator [Chryseobacterium muglaense]MCC9036166.1 helix-turn-helix transcriptional regulator [Chryseobacterium muglaense]MCM2553259.1 helix-turn-helix transcriptional regulator [Chryseobacterium muglaense]